VERLTAQVFRSNIYLTTTIPLITTKSTQLRQLAAEVIAFS